MELRAQIDNFSQFLNKFEVDTVLPSILSQKLSLHEQPKLTLDFPETDYVNRWSLPPLADMREMQNLKMGLVDQRDVPEMVHALTFLHKSVKNLPAEFFLQPPYLYKNLLDCLLVEAFEKAALNVLLDLTKSLQARMKMRTLTRTCEVFVENDDDLATVRCQLSVPAFCYHLIKQVMRALTDLEDHSCQVRLNAFFELMSSVVNVLKSCKGSSENSTILREMAFVTKFYRKNFQSTKDDFRCRVNYFAVLQMIATLAAVRAKKERDVEIIASNEEERNPIWRDELEISLMDFSFREAMPDVYGQIYRICNAEDNARLVHLVHAAEVRTVTDYVV